MFAQGETTNLLLAGRQRRATARKESQSPSALASQDVICNRLFSLIHRIRRERGSNPKALDHRVITYGQVLVSDLTSPQTTILKRDIGVSDMVWQKSKTGNEMQKQATAKGNVLDTNSSDTEVEDKM